MANGRFLLDKIPNLFVPDSNNSPTPGINPACVWVYQGAHATKLYDGVGYMLEEDREYPLAFEDPESAAFATALQYHGSLFRPWSYELCGPDIKGNHERQPYPVLIPHGRRLYHVPPSYAAIRTFLAGRNTAGIVFWEDLWDPTCRKAKVAQADFGFRRNVTGALE